MRGPRTTAGLLAAFLLLFLPVAASAQEVRVRAQVDRSEMSEGEDVRRVPRQSQKRSEEHTSELQSR